MVTWASAADMGCCCLSLSRWTKLGLLQEPAHSWIYRTTWACQLWSHQHREHSIGKNQRMAHWQQKVNTLVQCQNEMGCNKDSVLKLGGSRGMPSPQNSHISQNWSITESVWKAMTRKVMLRKTSTSYVILSYHASSYDSFCLCLWVCLKSN